MTAYPHQCDLLVVGASFAGLSVAKAAAEAGLRVTVVEKKRHVGEHLHTTGIVVKDTVEQNPWLQSMDKSLIKRIEGVRLYAPNLQHIDLVAPGYYFWATDTTKMLQTMQSGVQKLGVTFMMNTVFVGAAFKNQTWTVATTKSTSSTSSSSSTPSTPAANPSEHAASALTARYLVGADGPKSKVAKALALSTNQHFLYGLEHEYPHAKMDSEVLHCFLQKHLARGYMGWALAGVEQNQIGLAQRYRPPAQNPPDMQGYLAHIAPFVQLQGSSPENPIVPHGIRAGLIPCGGVLSHIGRTRALLVGDAAGMVSPVTAGGIHTALTHGAFVGKSVAQYLHNEKSQTDPAHWMRSSYPQFGLKRLLRVAFDHFQTDWAFNWMLKTQTMRQVASRIYFHQRAAKIV